MLVNRIQIRKLAAPALAAVIAALLAFVPAPQAGAADHPLTLDDAIAMAIAKNEDLVIERQSLAAADAGVTGSRGAYDPLLSVETAWHRATAPTNSPFSGAPEGQPAPTATSTEAGVTVSQLFPTGGTLSLRAAAARNTTDGTFALLSPAYDSQVGFEFRQPLLRDRAIDSARLTVRLADADRDGAAAALERAVSDTVAAVEQAYWTLVAARREVGVREEAVGLADEQLDQTKIRIENGASPETEISQPRAELERRRGELLAAREAAARAENALKLLILADADGDVWADRPVPGDEAETTVQPVDLAAALDRALTSRPELDAAAAVIDRRRAETSFAKDGVKPSLDAVVSYDRFGLAGGLNPAGASLPGLPVEVPSGQDGGLGKSFETLGRGDFDDARVALVLGIPIGNRTARAAAVAAKSNELAAEADLARARKAVRAEVLDAAATLDTAGQRIEAARAGREAAEVQLSSERERYAAGLSTNFLVLTRQNDLSRARLDEISALTDYRTARVEMARATGSLLGERGIELSTATDIDSDTPADGGR